MPRGMSSLFIYYIIKLNGMAIKATSSRPKNAGGYSSKNYKKPKWMQQLRIVFIVILCVLVLLVIVGLVKHLISHFN